MQWLAFAVMAEKNDTNGTYDWKKLKLLWGLILRKEYYVKEYFTNQSNVIAITKSIILMHIKSFQNSKVEILKKVK